ncbi:hypothetical protein IAE22_35140, partial [Bacillus sp. S34]|nr:hypothetical protein [Bacillus sp. S34]
SNETLPPGRIHAVSVAQPLLWRPFGWWDVRINRATNAGNGASNNQQVSSIVLPVGTARDVREVLDNARWKMTTNEFPPEHAGA